NRSYRYKIEYGKVGSNGDVATWYNAGLFPANATATASLQTTQNFNFTLLSNQANSSGSYRIRVTDQLLPRRFALTIVR
ncbi:MAG: hypothetical protein KKG00_17735, partial [Bacteroidetes bacterium]|nr:hypothetical protein [Bacteroidota bacterium]